jgi:hypothetical protein
LKTEYEKITGAGKTARRAIVRADWMRGEYKSHMDAKGGRKITAK